MKRALKITIPILLAVAVVVSIGWYFLKYDPDLTRDILVSQARILDNQGNHTLATWFYKLAYQQSGNDEAIALELAEQYRSIGNYTKAEYTLSNAIADGGSVELYIALCNVYVEQDKLLDAVTMLDSVADEHIKAQLEALRPEVPKPSHEPGHYNQYISLAFTVPEGTICFTADGRYPSGKDTSFNSVISLPAGETVIHSLTIGQNGLVSPLSVIRYTVAGVIEEVIIEDSALNQEIRRQLQVDENHVLYTNELWTITALTVPAKTESLSDLAKLPFLKSLTIQDLDSPTPTPIDALDLSAIRGLEALEELNISNMTMSDENLEIIAALPKLKVLNMIKCSLSGIGPLESAIELTHLDLSANTIGDLTALEGMTKLTYLNLNHNAVTDLSALSGLTKLEQLDLSYNSITDTAPLASCTAVKSLNLSGNTLTGVEGLEQLVKLEYLSLAFNTLTDVSPLAANTALTELDISNNEITDITMLDTLSKLTSLNFSYNQVTKLPEFGMDSVLVTIKGSRNKLTSLDELAGLERLNNVMMDFNEELDSVNALAGCYALVEVSVYGTKVREVDALTDMGVIVKYSPI